MKHLTIPRLTNPRSPVASPPVASSPCSRLAAHRARFGGLPLAQSEGIFRAAWIAAGVAVGLLHAAQVSAEMTDTITARELGLLPSWCQYTQSFDRTESAPGHYQSYVERFGTGWTHMHHFCWALVSEQRARSFDTAPHLRETFTRNALADLDYVIKRSPPNFILLFDVYHRKAKLLLLDERFDDAHDVASTIVERWPERADAHGLLAQALIGQGKPAEATRQLDDLAGTVIDRERLQQIRAVLNR